jgi:hypothetical protein
MAVSLRTYLNNQLKTKGMTATQAKKNAGKYKSIAAAKKAGSLYYTDKNGKVMAAVYAEDLKKPLGAIKPKKKPLGAPKKNNIITSTISDTKGGRGDGLRESVKRKLDPKSPSGLKGQSAEFNAFFEKNKAKYKKDNGGFNTRQALKDFNARSK